MLHPGAQGLASPSKVRTGNAFGMSWMAIAAVTTVALIVMPKSEAPTGGMGFGKMIRGVVAGGATGVFASKKVEMTKVPELVAAMHSLIGMAAVLHRGRRGVRAVGPQYHHAPLPLPFGNRMECSSAFTAYIQSDFR